MLPGKVSRPGRETRGRDSDQAIGPSVGKKTLVDQVPTVSSGPRVSSGDAGPPGAASADLPTTTPEMSPEERPADNSTAGKRPSSGTSRQRFDDRGAQAPASVGDLWQRDANGDATLDASPAGVAQGHGEDAREPRNADGNGAHTEKHDQARPAVRTRCPNCGLKPAMTKYRPYIMPPDAQRLDDLAATQIIADVEVAHCWELVRVGIQTLKLGTGNLGKLIGHLRAGNGMTLDELTIEVEPPGSDRMLVGILDDQRTCSASKMIDELERLTEREGTSNDERDQP